VLLGAMLLAGSGYQGWAWAYAGYSAIGGLGVWLILSGRICWEPPPGCERYAVHGRHATDLARQQHFQRQQ
jgi:hypothetical protein